MTDTIPFDETLTFHTATAWSTVIGTVVHVLAHMVNFYKLMLADTSTKTGGAEFVAFPEARNGNVSTSTTFGTLITSIILFVLIKPIVCRTTLGTPLASSRATRWRRYLDLEARPS